MSEQTKQKKKKAKSREQATKRHQFLLSFLRGLVGWFFRLRFNFQFQKVKLKHTPTVILVNHNSNYDPILTGIAFKDFMYFVASEHVLRWGFFSRFVKFVFDPIIRVKGTTEARAAMDILKTLRKGHNVCIYAEGDRSYNGETGPILASTGKLVKKSGAALVTYVLRGAYLSTPRWGEKIRRGVIKGELVNEYSPEQIAAMSDDEINTAIVEDLYVNAYFDQKEIDVQYRARRKYLASGIELALYLCPFCGRYGTIKSDKDRFRCGCGLHMRYTKRGWLTSIGRYPVRFDNILEWDHWQQEELKKMLLSSDDVEEPIFTDGGQQLFEIVEQVNVREVTSGTLKLYRDRIEINGKQGVEIFSFDNLDDLEITARMNITFMTSEGRKFEIRSSILRSPVKYRESYRILTSREGVEKMAEFAALKA